MDLLFKENYSHLNLFLWILERVALVMALIYLLIPTKSKDSQRRWGIPCLSFQAQLALSNRSRILKKRRKKSACYFSASKLSESDEFLMKARFQIFHGSTPIHGFLGIHLKSKSMHYHVVYA
jgi:hypothetical protein